MRRTKGRTLPHKWLKNRPIVRITPEADRDTGVDTFWVPLPKRPRGPYVVRVTLRDHNGATLDLAKSSKIE